MDLEQLTKIPILSLNPFLTIWIIHHLDETYYKKNLWQFSLSYEPFENQ